MAIPTFETEAFGVFDDFLDQASLENLRRYFADERFSYVKSFRARSRVFGLLDGDPLVAPSVVHHHPGPIKGAAPYPAGNALDGMVQGIESARDALGRWTGTQGETWDFFTCTPYLYPVGSGLSWHDDSKDRAASYVFYLHDEWKSSWGAELLIGSSQPDSNSDVVGDTSVPSVGTYIKPCPNRLVVIKAGTPHTVKRVDIGAGENVRMSIAGFFQSQS
ncbi:2OG-Fe(II) oxygenase [Streptomyces sp. NPDC092903]|uniref:2OG-Fe(II) oxygenase n=1 Tax=Streptomyces sp. NPDC092903 TaxID=3366017 RepID=UPI00381CD02D